MVGTHAKPCDTHSDRLMALIGFCLAIALSLLLGLLAVSSSAFAGDWKLLPVRDADFKPEVTVSAVAGSLDPQQGGAGTYGGIELALNCLLLQPPSGVMRTHISLGQFDHDGLKLSDFEINPRWTV